MTPLTGAAAASALEAQTTSDSATQAKVAAGKFEELLLGELLKAMRATVPKSEDGGFAQDMAYGMFDQAIAEATAGHLGMSTVFERQLGGAAAPIVPARRAGALSPGVRVATGSAPPSVATPSGPKLSVGVVGSSLPMAGADPVDGIRSSDYGMRVHPLTGEHKFHGGIDIAAPEGTEIRAVASGVVAFAGRRPGYGNVVEIEHADGATTRYAHASRVHVRTGDVVDVGEAVADVGSTGQSTGPHLHFEVRRRGHTVDPDRYLEGLRRRSRDALAPERTGVVGADMPEPMARELLKRTP